MQPRTSASATDSSLLEKAGLPGDLVAPWFASRPEAIGDYERDIAAFSRGWLIGADLLAKLPKKPHRSALETEAAALITHSDRASRDRFLATHAASLYRLLTNDYTSFTRVENLVYDAAERVPGLAPTRAQVAAESEMRQQHKDGVEIDQGILLSHILAQPKSGMHLCHAMLLPRPEAVERLPHFLAKGTLDFTGATVTRQGKATLVTMRNRRFLNAEDETTLDGLEIAADLATQDPDSGVAILRGDTVEHPKYSGRRLFSAGINLTHLYHGKISFVWYIKRDMGFVNKLFRGLARPELGPDEVGGDALEKPWIAVVDGFAIGGGCHILLATDYVVAASDAYMTLPARKEGIIPGAANLRLWRFTGDRIARQAILYGRRLDCDSPEGRLVCDEVVPPEQLDSAIEQVVEGFTNSGVVSAAGNRRAIRAGQEPLDLFRRYMAVYAREQAQCHFSPALIANLERNWSAQQRRP